VTLHGCRDRGRLLGPYLDGELEASKLIEIDEHVTGCETCREETQLLRAMRGSLKRVVKMPASAGLRDRIGTAMAAEKVREDVKADADAEALGARAPLVSLSSWKTMVPLATAAALALVWGAATRANQPGSTEARAGFGDDLLAELVAEHSQPLPMEAKDIDSVRGLERYVGVPVRPAMFERPGMNAHLVGARVVPLHSQRAAMLQYIVQTGTGTQRVSLIVYDAQKIQIGTANLTPKEVGTAEVRVGLEKGYSVAATQRAGVGYVVASDLDPEQSAKFAALAYDER
jgi:anti-sigma factor RsiW